MAGARDASRRVRAARCAAYSRVVAHRHDAIEPRLAGDDERRRRRRAASSCRRSTRFERAGHASRHSATARTCASVTRQACEVRSAARARPRVGRGDLRIQPQRLTHEERRQQPRRAQVELRRGDRASTRAAAPKRAPATRCDPDSGRRMPRQSARRTTRRRSPPGRRLRHRARRVPGPRSTRTLASSNRPPADGSSASENVITRHRCASASIAGFIHSQRPCTPGITTIGVPPPRSMIFIGNQLLSQLGPGPV